MRRTRRTAPSRRPLDAQVEATIGFEPMNSGFADRRVRPLRHVAGSGVVSPGDVELAAPRGFEPRLTDPKSAVLPLDEGAAVPGVELGAGENGAEDGTRTRDPHLGKVMLYQLSHFRSKMRRPADGAESQIRTGDTAIFSRVLYQLSYLGPDPGPREAPSAGRRIPCAPIERQGDGPPAGCPEAIPAGDTDPAVRAASAGRRAVPRAAPAGAGRSRTRARGRSAGCRSGPGPGARAAG